MGLRKALGLRKPKKAPEKAGRPPVNVVLWQRAAESSADFVENHLRTAMLFDRRDALHKFAFDDLLSEGLLMEFGVFKGESINAFADDLADKGDSRKIYGFDAFEGLQENWHGIGYHRSRNHFNLGGRKPDVRSRVRLVPGWIDATLPVFLNESAGPIAFIHIDTDTYLPAKTILSLCKSRLVPGSLILFDELIDYPGWKDGEYKALQEEIDPSYYEWVGFSGWSAMLKVVSVSKDR